MILGITVFLVVNTYYDGKYTKMLSINQKYFKMAMFAFVGFSMYLLIKKNPKGSKSMLQHANALIKYMPVDRETADLISPIFDFTNAKNSMDSMTQSYTAYNDDTPQQRRMLNSGGNSTKRSVSETNKLSLRQIIKYLYLSLLLLFLNAIIPLLMIGFLH